MSWFPLTPASLDSFLSPFTPSQCQFCLSPNICGGPTRVFLSSALTPAGLIPSAGLVILLILTAQSQGYKRSVEKKTTSNLNH